MKNPAKKLNYGAVNRWFPLVRKCDDPVANFARIRVTKPKETRTDRAKSQ